MTYVTTTRAVGSSLDDVVEEGNRLARQFAGDRPWIINWPTTIESGLGTNSDTTERPQVVFSAEITITVEEWENG